MSINLNEVIDRTDGRCWAGMAPKCAACMRGMRFVFQRIRAGVRPPNPPDGMLARNRRGLNTTGRGVIPSARRPDPNVPERPPTT
jgi:hypothetical protein